MDRNPPVSKHSAAFLSPEMAKAAPRRRSSLAGIARKKSVTGATPSPVPEGLPRTSSDTELAGPSTLSRQNTKSSLFRQKLALDAVDAGKKLLKKAQEVAQELGNSGSSSDDDDIKKELDKREAKKMGLIEKSRKNRDQSTTPEITSGLVSPAPVSVSSTPPRSSSGSAVQLRRTSADNGASLAVKTHKRSKVDEQFVLPKTSVTFSTTPSVSPEAQPLAAERLKEQHEVSWTGLDPMCPLHGYCRSLSGQKSHHDDYRQKLLRLRKLSNVPTGRRLKMEREKNKLLRNLFALTLAFVFVTTAFHAIQCLQSTIHPENGLGSVSLAIVFIGSAATCLYLPGYILNRLGSKYTMVVSMLVYVFYMCVNFNGKWHSLVPVSFLTGIAGAAMWSAKDAYISVIASLYATLNYEDSAAVVTRFFGIYFIVIHFGMIIGNISASKLIEAVTGVSDNPPNEVYRDCGHYFEPMSHFMDMGPMLNLQKPEASAIHSICAVFLGCTIAAPLVVMAFLNDLRKDYIQVTSKPHFSLNVAKDTLRNLCQPGYALIVPITIYSGMEQAFLTATFTRSFVACCLGIPKIGYVLVSYGVASAVCVFVFGPLCKLFGRMPLITFGAVVHMLMIFAVILWPPNPADESYFYVVAGTWGMADGVWQTQIAGLWLSTYAGSIEHGTANHRFWDAIGHVVIYLATPFINTEGILYILLAALLIGLSGYILIEMWDLVEDRTFAVRHHLQRFLTIPSKLMLHQKTSTGSGRSSSLPPKPDSNGEVFVLQPRHHPVKFE